MEDAAADQRGRRESHSAGRITEGAVGADREVARIDEGAAGVVVRSGERQLAEAALRERDRAGDLCPDGEDSVRVVLIDDEVRRAGGQCLGGSRGNRHIVCAHRGGDQNAAAIDGGVGVQRDRVGTGPREADAVDIAARGDRSSRRRGVEVVRGSEAGREGAGIRDDAARGHRGPGVADIRSAIEKATEVVGVRGRDCADSGEREAHRAAGVAGDGAEREDCGSAADFGRGDSGCAGQEVRGGEILDFGSGIGAGHEQRAAGKGQRVRCDQVVGVGHAGKVQVEDARIDAGGPRVCLRRLKVQLAETGLGQAAGAAESDLDAHGVVVGVDRETTGTVQLHLRGAELTDEVALIAHGAQRAAIRIDLSERVARRVVEVVRGEDAAVEVQRRNQSASLFVELDDAAVGREQTARHIHQTARSVQVADVKIAAHAAANGDRAASLVERAVAGLADHAVAVGGERAAVHGENAHARGVVADAQFLIGVIH